MPDTERRPPPIPDGWSEEQFEQFVEHVSTRIIDNFYREVGRNVVDKIFKVVGVAVVALATYAGITGKFGGWMR